MTREADALWRRCFVSLNSAEILLAQSPNDSSSRSYFAAFYAVSAHFALIGTLFNSHEGVEIFFHKDLIKPGIFPKEFSELWKGLKKARQIGDYGVYDDISEQGALTNIESAKTIIEAVYRLHPDEFSRPAWVKEI